MAANPFLVVYLFGTSKVDSFIYDLKHVKKESMEILINLLSSHFFKLFMLHKTYHGTTFLLFTIVGYSCYGDLI
jgi:hypothetical protein